MSETKISCRLSRKEVIDTYFLEHRAKLLDIAAFLDRVDRAAASATDVDDFRLVAYSRALAVLGSPGPGRVRRMQEILSDATTVIPESAAGLKGAFGAPPEPES